MLPNLNKNTLIKTESVHHKKQNTLLKIIKISQPINPKFKKHNTSNVEKTQPARKSKRGSLRVKEIEFEIYAFVDTFLWI